MLINKATFIKTTGRSQDPRLIVQVSLKSVANQIEIRVDLLRLPVPISTEVLAAICAI